MDRADVPETAVNEYCNLLTGEADIDSCPRGNFPDQVVLAKPQAPSMKYGAQSDFWLSIDASIRLADLRRRAR